MHASYNGLNYQISVALPEDYHSHNNDYPVLFGLDANMEFGTLVETARNLNAMWMTEKIIIVGIGYDVQSSWNDVMPQRSLDLTPTQDEHWLHERNIANEKYGLPLYLGTGGAESFLKFIRHDLIPYIEKNYRVKKHGRAIFGHSFGGLFASYALFQEQPIFEKFIIGSPSLWWGANHENEGAIFLQEESFSKTNAGLNAEVFLSVGALEESPEDARFQMISNVRKLEEILKSRHYKGLTLTTKIMEEEHHMSVIPSQINHGLRTIYPKNTNN